jgi:PAS domain-containing protein
MPTDLLSAAFDAFPSFVFLVDRDVRIHAANTAAMKLTGTTEKARVLLMRGGDAIKCVNSTLTPGGCSCADACKKCVVRNSVKECLDTKTVVRGRTRFQQTDSSGTHDAFFLITASPFRADGKELVVLCLDDLGAQLQLRGILPICAHCHRVRNEQNEWEDVQRYVSSSLSVDLSHGICDPCLDKYHPE